MILDLVNKLSSLWHSKNVKTTSFIFRIITKYTVNMSIIFMILICTTNLFGNPIECYSDDSNWVNAMQLKCWLHGVYIYEELLDNFLEIGKHMLYHGVGSHKSDADMTKITFRFYQWIVPLMLFQTFCFALPRIIWHFYEKGTMMKLLEEIYSPVFTDDWVNRRKRLISYVKDVCKKYHRQYAYKYLLCEILTIVVVLLNMFSMDFVITDFWATYKSAVTALLVGNFDKFSQEASRLFPIQAKCDFYSVGSSGTIQQKDALCFLAQNVINEKIFVFLYIWYIFILICAIFNVLYFIAMASSKILRIYDIGHMLERKITIRDSKIISANGDFGLWFTLSIYRKNMVSIYFQDLCSVLHAELKQENNFAKTLNFPDEDDDEKYL